jgi:hypothetical protein
MFATLALASGASASLRCFLRTMAFQNLSKPTEEQPTYRRYPCCGYLTLCGRAGYEICPVCFWEDDRQDSHDADEVRGGPNG